MQFVTKKRERVACGSASTHISAQPTECNCRFVKNAPEMVEVHTIRIYIIGF